jgi:hypothetical protein
MRPDVFPRMTDLFAALSTKIGYFKGVRGLYNTEGMPLTELSELTEGLDVIVAPSAEPHKEDRASGLNAKFHKAGFHLVQSVN